MNPAALRPARRFLHVCYCCSDTVPVTSFFVDHLALRNTMSTPVERSGGGILGLDDDILGAAAFVFDGRGPRTSPAIEVQSWIEPALLGEPIEDPTAVGIRALGFAVADVSAAAGRLVEQGCSVVGEGDSPFSSPWATLRDPRGVTLDLVGDSGLAGAATRMHHLRVTCSDLDASLVWYRGLGFELLERVELGEGAFLGLAGELRGTAARLRLPDEGFELVLIEYRTPPGHGRHVTEPNHAGLFRTAVAVDDTRAAHAELSASGWAFDRAPMAVELTGTPVPDMWICFLSDPDGVPFEFVERPRSAFA